MTWTAFQLTIETVQPHFHLSRHAISGADAKAWSDQRRTGFWLRSACGNCTGMRRHSKLPVRSETDLQVLSAMSGTDVSCVLSGTSLAIQSSLKAQVGAVWTRLKQLGLCVSRLALGLPDIRVQLVCVSEFACEHEPHVTLADKSRVYCPAAPLRRPSFHHRPLLSSIPARVPGQLPLPLPLFMPLPLPLPLS